MATKKQVPKKTTRRKVKNFTELMPQGLSRRAKREWKRATASGTRLSTPTSSVTAHSRGKPKKSRKKNQ